MSRSIKVLGILGAVIVCVPVIALVLIGAYGPDTFVYTGRQVPERFVSTIRSLNLLQPDEQIRYFYSDALLDIKAGLYFVTDKNLVLYSTEWDPPEIVIPFDQIESVDAEYVDSVWEDSAVYITTRSGVDVAFPVSAEKGLDRKFVEAIKEKVNTE